MGAKARKKLAVGGHRNQQTEMMRVSRDFADLVRSIAKRQKLTFAQVTSSIAYDLQEGDE